MTAIMSVNLADRNGWAPLHFAAQNYDEGMARLLLDSGASIDSRDANGNTPLSTAVFSSRGRGELIELLRQRGAGATSTNNFGVSPVNLAQSPEGMNFMRQRYLPVQRRMLTDRSHQFPAPFPSTVANSLHSLRIGQTSEEVALRSIAEKTKTLVMFLLAQLRDCFQEIRLRLFQLSNEPPMAVTINRFPSFYIVQERILSRAHFRFCSLYLLPVAHHSTSVCAPLL